MGQAKQKQRECPVAGRRISPAECGSKRISEYACPSECPFNPWGMDQYDNYLAIENRLEAKQMRAVGKQYPYGIPGLSVEPDTDEVSNLRSYSVLRRAMMGVSLDSFALKNDERVLWEAKCRMRIAVLEVRQVINDEDLELVDRLDTPPTPFLAKDRALASSAARFDRFLVWIFDLPCYARVHGVAAVIPDDPEREGEEIITALAVYAGGPPDPETLRAWLQENDLRMYEALHALTSVKKQAWIDNSTIKRRETVFAVDRPWSEVRARMEGHPDLHEIPPDSEDVPEGYDDVWDWLVDDDALEKITGMRSPMTGYPPGTLAALGVIAARKGEIHVQAFSDAFHDYIQGQLEAVLEGPLQLKASFEDDLSKRIWDSPIDYDASLVPPSLFEKKGGLLGITYRVPQSETAAMTRERLDAMMDRATLDIIDQTFPVLGGRTPREAAALPEWRPRLITFLKDRIRSLDRENLRTGKNRDLGEVVRELRLHEIDVPPPPPREVPDYDVDYEVDEDESNEGEWFETEALPPLPKRKLEKAEVDERFLLIGIAPGDSREWLVDSLEDVPPLLQTVADIIVGRHATSPEQDAFCSITYLTLDFYDLDEREMEKRLYTAASRLVDRVQKSDGSTIATEIEKSAQPALLERLCMMLLVAEDEGEGGSFLTYRHVLWLSCLIGALEDLRMGPDEWLPARE